MTFADLPAIDAALDTLAKSGALMTDVGRALYAKQEQLARDPAQIAKRAEVMAKRTPNNGSERLQIAQAAASCVEAHVTKAAGHTDAQALDAFLRTPAGREAYAEYDATLRALG